MLPDPDSLDLSELAEATGVSQRTIRYYVQQGLLPSPGTRGPGTRYDRSMVERLQLIKLLQRHHWPLSKIRDHLERLDDAGVRRELAHPPAPQVSESALTYVRDVLGGRARERGGLRLRSPASAELEGDESEGPFAPLRAAASRSRWELKRSTWEQIRLAPDVELWIRRPATREQNKLVERLVQAARDYFSEEP